MKKAFQSHALLSDDVLCDSSSTMNTGIPGAGSGTIARHVLPLRVVINFWLLKHENRRVSKQTVSVSSGSSCDDSSGYDPLAQHHTQDI